MKLSSAWLLLACLSACDKSPSNANVRKDIHYEAPIASDVDAGLGRLRLADRALVESILLDVFGPSLRADITRDVRENPAVFGGPCNLYEQVYVRDEAGNPTLAEGASACVGGMPALNHPMIGASNTLRAGWIAKACFAATTQDESMRYALSAVFANRTSGAPDALSVANAHALFYPGRDLSEDVLQALLAITPDADDATRWRFIFRTLCLTPDWQIP